MWQQCPTQQLTKWPPQCFAPDVPWAGGKQRKAHGTMLGAKKSPVWGLKGWGKTSGDRTLCLAPTDCKWGCGVNPTGMAMRQQSQCALEMWSGRPPANVFRGIFPGKMRWLSSENPKTEQNTGFTRALHRQNCSLIYALSSLVHMATDRPGDLCAAHHNMAFSMVSWLLPGQLRQLGLPVATHFTFSKSAVSCLGLFKLIFFLFTFILVFVIKVLIRPMRAFGTWRFSTGLACIRGGQFPNCRLSFNIPALLALLRKTRGTHAASCKDLLCFQQDETMAGIFWPER